MGFGGGKGGMNSLMVKGPLMVDDSLTIKSSLEKASRRFDRRHRHSRERQVEGRDEMR